MAKKKAYLLPENPNPPGDRCIVVYLPDDDAFQRALMGSLEFLATWVAWENDEGHTALVAGQRMKQANLRTINTMAVVDCEFLNELLEDGDMSVNITNNVSCGECGGSGGTCLCPSVPLAPVGGVHDPLPPAQEIADLPEQEDPGVGFPDGFNDRATYLLHKCQAANALAYDIIETIGNLQTLHGLILAGGVGALIAAISSTTLLATLAAPLVLIPGVNGILAVSLVIAALVVLAGYGAGFFLYFGAVHAIATANFRDLVCDLYTATTPDHAKQVVVDRFKSWVGEVVYDIAEDEDKFSPIIIQILEAMIPANAFKVLFATLTAIEDYLENRDITDNCSDCVDNLGWVAIPATGFTLGTVTNLSNQNIVFQNGRLTVEGDATGEPARVEFELDAPADSAGHAAYLVLAEFGNEPYNGYIQWGDTQGVNDLAFNHISVPDARYRGRGTNEPTAEFKATFDVWQEGTPGSWTVANWDAEIADGKVSVKIERSGSSLNGNTLRWIVDLYLVVPTSF